MNFKLLQAAQLDSVGLSWTLGEYHHLVRFDAGGAPISTEWVVFWEGGVLPSAFDVKADGVKPNSSCYRTIMHGNLATKFHTGLVD